MCEFLCGSTINDIYFVHERGWPIALFTIALLNGINGACLSINSRWRREEAAHAYDNADRAFPTVTPPISGQVFAHLGWRWCWRIFCELRKAQAMAVGSVALGE